MDPETRAGQIADMREDLAGQLPEMPIRVGNLIAESHERIRRHFDVIAETLRADIRALAELVTRMDEASMLRDAELSRRLDRLDHRLIRLESRVSALEASRRRGCRRRRPLDGRCSG